MTGVVKHTKLESRTSRARLERKKEPHWRTLIINRAHLGWQRQPRLAGRWVVRKYEDGKYKHRTLGLADDLAEANGETVLSFEQAEAAAKAILDAPTALLSRYTVRKALAAYIEYQSDHGKPVADLTSRTNAHILPRLGDAIVAELTTERLRKWRTALASEPAMKRSAQGTNAYKAAPVTEEQVRQRRSSTNRVWTMLRAALNRAFIDGKVSSDLAWRGVKPFRGVDAARTGYLELAECKRLINASDREFRPLVKAALATGCRYGELIRLECRDFNRDSRTVHIRRSKSGESRHVYLNDEGVEFFAQDVCAGRLGSELMFRHSEGSPWKPSQQARPMAEACARAKIKLTFHGLRHVYTSHCVKNGIQLLILARNLGHSGVTMITKHYAHLAPSYVADAIRANGPRFGGAVRERKVVPLG